MNVTATRFSTQARTWVLIAGLSALLVAIGGRVLGGVGYLLFGGLSVGMVFVSYWFSDRFAIRASHAQAISEADDPRLYAIVADLAQRAKVPMPRVYLIPSEQPNAFATGRNPKHSAVAVTAGLRKYLPEDQIRGVLAHEFAHIKNRDILVSSIAAMIASAISAIANILQFGMIFGGGPPLAPPRKGEGDRSAGEVRSRPATSRHLTPPFAAGWGGRSCRLWRPACP